MSPQEMSDLAEEFIKAADRKAAKTLDPEQRHDYENALAVNETLRQSYLGLEEVRKWIMNAIDIEPDRKRARLLIRMAAKIDDIQLDLEELL